MHEPFAVDSPDAQRAVRVDPGRAAFIRHLLNLPSDACAVHRRRLLAPLSANLVGQARSQSCASLAQANQQPGLALSLLG